MEGSTLNKLETKERDLKVERDALRESMRAARGRGDEATQLYDRAIVIEKQLSYVSRSIAREWSALDKG